ncbi:MAG: SDR family oxidoreductase [Alphaproteobacteria bacterium]|nr:SDR family oxidoreductase [Alphaproteobacteria bacterium]
MERENPAKLEIATWRRYLAASTRGEAFMTATMPDEDPGAGFGLAGRVAVVTGAASGIGRATAERLTAAGVRVTGVDLRPIAAGPCEASIEEDLSRLEACERVIDTVLARAGRLDILVNAAAILRRVPIAGADAALWDEVMDANLLSQFALCRAAARSMRRQGGGRIVNVSSTAAFNGGADNSSIYAISKGGVLALTKSLARQFAADNVQVNAICPGGIDTPMGRYGFTEESWNAHFAARVPLRRAGRPEEVADAILFLCSDWASYVTGHTLDVEGGLMLR